MSKPKEIDTAQTASNQPLMYIGPRLNNPLPLAHATVFSHGLPPALATHPHITALCVPLSQAGAAMQGVKKGTSPLASHITALIKAGN